LKKYTIAFLVLFVTLIGMRQIDASKPVQSATQISAEVQTEPEQQTVNENGAQQGPTSDMAIAALQPETPSPAPVKVVTPAVPVKQAAAAPKVPTPKPAPVVAKVPAPTPAPKATGSNENPAPTVIKNVSAVSKETFPSCTQSDFNSKFLCLINNYRAENGKGALKYDSTLNAVAAKYSAYMNSANFFSHVAPDGTHYYERCEAMQTTCHAENLAKGFLSAQNLFDMWRSSASHNKNMLGNYTTIGLGISGQYATNVFRW
jgi:uncharacterized protein YkwD